VEYLQIHGDFKVPQQCSANPQLGTWVMTQRRNKQTDRLDFERQNQLDSIGFEWGKEEEISGYIRSIGAERRIGQSLLY
jgi:hypothetical protein